MADDDVDIAFLFDNEPPHIEEDESLAEIMQVAVYFGKRLSKANPVRL